MIVDLHNSRAGEHPSGVQGEITTYLNSFGEKDKSGETKRLEDNTNLFISRTLDKIIPSSFNKSYSPCNGTLNFSIRNVGNEMAQDVAISLPFEGKAYVISENKEKHAIEVKRSIEIGNIRQGEIIWVNMWSTERPDLKHEGSIRLTHSSGIGNISFAVSELGLSYTILRDYYILILLALAVLLFGSYIGYGFLIEYATGIPIITTGASEQ